MSIDQVKSDIIFWISEMLKYLSILSNFLFKPNLRWVFKSSFCRQEVKLLALVLHLLEYWTLVCKYSHIWSLRKYTFLCEVPLFLMMSRFFSKRSGLFGKNNTFTQNNSVRAALEIFRSDFSFDKIESYCLWKY